MKIFLKNFFLTIFLISSTYSLNIPESYGGTVISRDEWKQYMDYCFYTRILFLESAYNFSSESQIDMNYRIYDIAGGQMVFGVGELILHCYTENEAIKVYGGTNNMPGNVTGSISNYYLKRGKTDRCNGFDWFSGFWFVYGCTPETGEWYIIPNSVGGSTNDRAGTYDCYNPETDDFYGGSSYLHLVVNKTKIFGVNYDDNYYYRSFACVVDNENVENYTGLVKLQAGLTTSRATSDIPNSGGTGGSGGGASDEKIEEIKTQLTQIQNQNSSFQSEALGKISQVNNDILIQNQQIAVSQNDLMEKLDILEQKNYALQEQIITNLEQHNRDLFNDVSRDNEEQTNALKSRMQTLENHLEDEINDNNSNINELKDLINNYNSDSSSGREEILNRLSGLENQINGLGSSLEDIGNGSGLSNGNDEMINALGDGLGKIDETLNNGLFDENQNPYLRTIDESLKGQTSPLDDNSQAESEINSFVGSELGFALNKYSNLLGGGFCSAPSNITMSLMGKQYTLIDYNSINPYVDVIRSVFISLAYLIGLFLFLRVK